MEDSFRVRVDKAFGNLGSNKASSVRGVSPSLWSLTDEEIERREWNRNKELAEDGDEEIDRREWNRNKELAEDGLKSGPSVIRNQLEWDLKELSNCEEEEEEEEEEEGEEIDGERKKRRGNSCGGAEASDDDFLDVQSNIGSDCTLDYEEEEDEYDKVAVGMEQTGDRLYMRKVKYADYGIDRVNGYGELPNTFQTASRDPRANHLAAKIRLREDAEAAGDFDTLQLSDSSMVTNSETEDHIKGELDVDNPKPILKKRDTSMDSKSQKRVRFMFDPKSSTHADEDQRSSGAGETASEPHATDDSAQSKRASDVSEYSAGVPDYLRNPSKYTRYSFDSSDDINDESNRKAYMDFFHYLRKRNTDTLLEDKSEEVPKSIVFTPKKKPEHDSMAKRNESEHNTRENLENKSWSVGVTAEDSQESEISAMEEDEPVQPADGGRSLRKSGRQYRTRANVDVEDN